MFAFKSLLSLARTANLHNISKTATKIWQKPNQRISRRTCTSMSVSEKNAHDFTQYQSAYVSARIQCTSPILDQLTEALMCFGANSISIDDADADEAYDEEASQKSYITAFFPAGEDVGACLALAADSIGLNVLPKYEVVEGDSNWVQQVQEIFQPIEITKDIWVIPEWRSPLDPEAVNIILDPGLAFGTGDHPTTRLCINFLKEFVKTGNTVLDYGTGSGILSIAAIHLLIRIKCMAMDDPCKYNRVPPKYNSHASLPREKRHDDKRECNGKKRPRSQSLKPNDGWKQPSPKSSSSVVWIQNPKADD